ncbi:putative Zinc-finger transcription factor hunchback [Daphnia magna]|uniref:Protein hunchback n=1 Tax=Daphnia magna TaxID=35525 RepID=A0A164X9N6_9CRUS|nr:putative Zinc-finger transcription factor hunchback [Daphnia magna]
MSSTCSVPATVNRALQPHPAAIPASDNRAPKQTDGTHSIGNGGISYEGRLSLLDPAAAVALNPSAMDFDQAVVLRRIKAECDMLDFQSIHHHKDNFMGVDVTALPLYSDGFSPNHPANGSTAGGFPSVDGVRTEQSAADGSVIKIPEYPSTPVRQQSTTNGMMTDPSGSNTRHQNDSGISPGSTGAAGSTNSSNDDTKKRNGNSESCGEDPTAGSAASGSPYSDHYSGDERRMLLTPTEEDDDDMMEDGADDDDDDELLDEEGSSHGTSSDVVGDALSRLERALMTQTGGNGAMTEGSSVPGGSVYQCNMCSYSATSRFHFQAHLNSHFDVKCTYCDFTARTEGKLRAHIRNAHSDVAGLDDEMGNSRVARVTTQGKLKTHKCKHPQCGFVGVSKLDFWEHTRTHIKAEKLLTCPHCPFVTEYKHHLEYHTRNHLNSKPFKCPKCSYSCVNKSMLNSHMKSHSNVYQFRCQDCAYATKYQHSLKLHLRKYGHTSTSKLSDMGPMDGCEMEVRKPKGRRSAKKPRQPKNSQRNTDAMTPNSVATSVQSNDPPGFHSNPPVTGSSPSIALQAFNFPMYPGAHHPHLNQQQPAPTDQEKKIRNSTTEEIKCGMCDFSTSNKDHFSQHLLAHAAAADQHHRELANLFGVIPADMLNSPPNPQSNQIHQQSVTPLKGSSSTPQQHQMKDYFSWMLANPTLLFGTPTAPVGQHQQLTERKKLSDTSRTPTPEVPKPTPTPPAPSAPSVRPNQTPLDLSREKDELLPASGGATNKHRRKGQAFKLERAIAAAASSPRQIAAQSPSAAMSGQPRESEDDDMEEEAEDEEEEEDEERGKLEEHDTEQEGKAGSPLWRPASNRKEIRKQRNSKCLPGGGEWGGAYQCSYCDIAFKDVVMYTMHMGYHGFQDPFTCNMCGQSTHDKLAFFLHIARSSHS